MDIYQHDSREVFRFVLKGDLTEVAAQELQWAWNTSKSIMSGKDLTIEISGVTSLTAAGIVLLARMRESGARIFAAEFLKCQELVRFVDLPATSFHAMRRRRSWPIRVLKAVGLAL
jgi:hypothetical protein